MYKTYMFFIIGCLMMGCSAEPMKEYAVADASKEFLKNNGIPYYFHSNFQTKFTCKPKVKK